MVSFRWKPHSEADRRAFIAPLDLQTALESDADRARTVMGEILDSITLSQEEPAIWADIESRTDR